MGGLWRKNTETKEGKYPIVLRRDGSVLGGPYFVIAFRDPCAAEAFTAYADAAEKQGLSPEYVSDIREMAEEAERIAADDPGDPDASRHRKDDPLLLAWAREAHHKAHGSA